MTRPRRSSDLLKVAYEPPSTYDLPLEVLSFRDLRRRATAEHLSVSQRLEFHQVIGISGGEGRHTIDFVQHRCRRGSWLVVRPGQAQRFDTKSAFDGWLVVFRPEFLLPLRRTSSREDLHVQANVDALADHQVLSEPEHRVCLTAVEQMHADASRDAPPAEMRSLLRHQLYALLLRLLAAQGWKERQSEVSSTSLRRFKLYRQAVEKEFARRHRLADYARDLDCSAKSLTRATLDVAGVSAKAYLAQRIALEAKRLLAHTVMPVSEVGARLGFDEPTNFGKFFKREAGATPGQFRLEYGAPRRTSAP